MPKTVQIKDSLMLDASGLSRTSDGYLRGMVKVARAGNVQQYRGSELGLTGDDAGKVFGVYRDPDVVFDEASMASLAGRPVTRNHPPEGVTARTWRDLAVGNIGGRIVRDGDHVVAPFAIMDASAADEIEQGAVGASAGYLTGIVADEGISPSGEAYQFRQSGPIRFNHVAYLPDNNPRAGNTRFGDARNWGLAPSTATSDQKEDTMSDALKTVVLGDKAAQVAVADAQIIEQFKADSAKALADAQTAHDAAIAAKDAAIAKIEAERDGLKAKVLSDADIDARVAARADLVTKAKAIADADFTGKTDAEIRKAAVAAKLGDAAIEGKSDAYIDARFDILCEDATPADPLRDALKDAQPVKDARAKAEEARAARHKSLMDGWNAPVTATQ